MKEPSEKDIKKEKQSELDKIADINAKCVSGYQTIRKVVYNYISVGDLDKMNKYITAEYGKVYTGLKGMIIDALNDAKDKNVKLVEKLLDESLPPAKHYEVLPKTSAFKYTNRVFTEKSVSVRSQKAADTITKIIADGRNDGLAIQDIQKKIDTVMGFRDAQGRLTDKSKKLIESGKFSHRNGSIYETYRIARTETMRMNAFAKYEQFLELREKYGDKVRLKLIATIDGRERSQSAIMNGYISNPMGMFLYPDGKYYRKGTQPAQWSINDREDLVIVFLDEKEVQEQIKKQETAEVGSLKEFYNDLKPAADAIRKELPIDKITTPEISKLFSKDYTKHYAIAGNLTEKAQKAINSDVTPLRVSFENLLKNQAKHPEIDFNMYSNMTNYIAKPFKQFSRGNQLITFIKQDNKLYELVIKTTQDKSINYFNSLHTSNLDELQKYIDKKK